MVLNRRWITVHKLTYSDEKDEYGQKRIPNSESPTSEDISVVWIIYSQKNVTNPNFVDVDIEMLTIADVDNKNVIEKDGELYNVKFIIPGKYHQVFLQKC